MIHRFVSILCLLFLCAATPATRPATRPAAQISPQWVLSVPWVAGDAADPRTPLGLSFGLGGWEEHGPGQLDRFIDPYLERWHKAGGRRVFIPMPFGRASNTYWFDQRRRINLDERLKGTQLQTAFAAWLAKWEARGMRFIIQTGGYTASRQWGMPELTTAQMLYELSPFASADLAMDSSILGGPQSVDYGIALMWRSRFYVERWPFAGEPNVEHWRRFNRLIVENALTNPDLDVHHELEFAGEYLVLQEGGSIDAPLQFIEMCHNWRKGRRKCTVTPAIRLESLDGLLGALGIVQQ